MTPESPNDLLPAGSKTSDICAPSWPEDRYYKFKLDELKIKNHFSRASICLLTKLA